MVGAQWDRANKNERGNRQHSTGRIKGHSINTYVTLCVCVCVLSVPVHPDPWSMGVCNPQ